MEDNGVKEKTESKKTNWKKWLVLGGIGLFVLYAILTPTPQENKDNAKAEQKTQSVAPAETKPVVRTVWDEGTYEVGKDVAVGKYTSTADNCYWAITNDTNGQDIVANGMQSGQQIVELTTPGQYFTVQRCNFKLAS